MADQNPKPQSDDQGSQGQKGTQSYNTGDSGNPNRKRDDNTGSSGTKGNQSYPAKGE